MVVAAPTIPRQNAEKVYLFNFSIGLPFAIWWKKFQSDVRCAHPRNRSNARHSSSSSLRYHGIAIDTLQFVNILSLPEIRLLLNCFFFSVFDKRKKKSKLLNKVCCFLSSKVGYFGATPLSSFTSLTATMPTTNHRPLIVRRIKGEGKKTDE